MVKNGSTDSLYYTYCDYQGNLLAVTDALGNVKEKLAYDPWGLRRSPDNWTQTDSRTSFLFSRGYTMHEHLDGFGLINMNGRVYDPLMAQFLSPDPFIQAPGNWYNYNRYGYCLNNPLIYNDPSGEIIGSLLAIWAGNYLINSVAYAINNNTSLKTAFKATPIVGGVGFSPTGFVTGQSNMGFSHPQLDAHLAAKTETSVSNGLSYSEQLEFGLRYYGGDYSGSFSDWFWYSIDFFNQMNPITNGWDVFTYISEGSDRFGNPMSPFDANLTAVTTVLPFLRIGKVLAIGKSSLPAAKGGSILAEASKVAFNAADDVGSIFIKNKHLSTSTGNWAKFATNEVSTAQGWVQQALRSPNARFLPNNQIPNTFQVVTNLGKTIGTKGETSIRVIVGYDGKVINAFPVK